MRTVRTIFWRNLSQLAGSTAATAGLGAFLALAGARFIWELLAGEGATTPVAAIWAVAAAPFLPVLGAISTMRMLSEERSSGRLDMLLAAPVLERDIVVGKFLAAWAHMAGAVGAYALMPLAVLPHFAPELGARLAWWGFVPAYAALMMQGALWCACGVMASALFRSAATAGLSAAMAMTALPYAAFHAATLWAPALRARVAEMPYEAHIADFATGLVSPATPVFYFALAGFALFAATKAVAMARYCGRGALGRRASTWTVTALAFVFACTAIAFAVRLRVKVEIPLRGAGAEVSARTRQILAETHGTVRATCFMSAKEPGFRAVGRMLRGLEATAREVAGTDLRVEYVDPRWERHKAQRLVARGAKEGSVVFERGRRRICVAVEDLFVKRAGGVDATGEGIFAGEAACATAIRRLARPAARETVYWTTGHGEASADSYDAATGMSDIARELRGDGYNLKALDLSVARDVPEDCAVLVCAGARDAFSRVELARLGAWLEKGGRLLALMAPGAKAGAAELLEEWGVKALPFTATSTRTHTGSDVVASDFADHKVTRPLKGSSLLFDGASVLEAGGEGRKAAGNADRTETTALVRTGDEAWGESEPGVRPVAWDAGREPRGPLTLAAAVERGGGASKDLAIRPTRIVAIGDAGFACNGALAARGNANRDFFLNAVAWLAGLDAIAAVRTAGDAVATGMDRGGWLRFGAACGGLTGGITALLLLLAAVRRRRGAR